MEDLPASSSVTGPVPSTTPSPSLQSYSQYEASEQARREDEYISTLVMDHVGTDLHTTPTVPSATPSPMLAAQHPTRRTPQSNAQLQRMQPTNQHTPLPVLGELHPPRRTTLTNSQVERVKANKAAASKRKANIQRRRSQANDALFREELHRCNMDSIEHNRGAVRKRFPHLLAHEVEGILRNIVMAEREERVRLGLIRRWSLSQHQRNSVTKNAAQLRISLYESAKVSLITKSRA